MGCALPVNPPETDHRERWVLTYQVAGDLRFISHHDTVRMFQRAFARAALPIRYTAGFNPHARLSLPMPRPVGVASLAEAIVVEFGEPMAGTGWLDALAKTMPTGLSLVTARPLADRERLLPDTVTYRLELAGDLPADLTSDINRLRDASTLEVQRMDRKRGQTRTIDLRPYLVELMFDAGAVVFSLRVTGSGTAKPAEIAGLLGFDPDTINHRICRMDVQWHTGSETDETP